MDLGLPVGPITCQGHDVVVVAGVHHKDGVVGVKVLALDLAGFLRSNFDAVSAHFCLGTGVGRFAVVVPVGPGRIDLDAQAFDIFEA